MINSEIFQEVLIVFDLFVRQRQIEISRLVERILFYSAQSLGNASLVFMLVVKRDVILWVCAVDFVVQGIAQVSHKVLVQGQPVWCFVEFFDEFWVIVVAVGVVELGFYEVDI